MNHKPCPFCGEVSDFELYIGDVPGSYNPSRQAASILCCQCGTCGPWVPDYDLSPNETEREAEAFKLWDERS